MVLQMLSLQLDFEIILTVWWHMSGIYSTWPANYFVGVLKYFCISFRLIKKKIVIVTNNEWHNSFLIGCVHNRCSSFLLPNLACITTFNTKPLSIADLNLKIVSSQVVSFIRSSLHVCSFHFHIWKQRLNWKRGSWVNEQCVKDQSFMRIERYSVETKRLEYNHQLGFEGEKYTTASVMVHFTWK